MHAVSVGDDIYARPSSMQLHTHQGLRRFGHELQHSLDSRRGNSGGDVEQRANRAGDALARGEAFQTPKTASPASTEAPRFDLAEGAQAWFGMVGHDLKRSWSNNSIVRFANEGGTLRDKLARRIDGMRSSVRGAAAKRQAVLRGLGITSGGARPAARSTPSAPRASATAKAARERLASARARTMARTPGSSKSVERKIAAKRRVRNANLGRRRARGSQSHAFRAAAKVAIGSRKQRRAKRSALRSAQFRRRK